MRDTPAVLPEGYRRQAFTALPSTSAEALAAARRGDRDRLWITAEVQTAGRGRRGRAWSTAKGNLAASLLLIDLAPASLAPTLSFVAAVALHRAAVGVAGPTLAERLALKWPNDLLLDGGKVAGILVEGENLRGARFAVVVGIGVNCVEHPQIDVGVPATSFAARGIAMPAEALFAELATNLAGEITAWDRGAGFAGIRSAWLARASGLGHAIRVNLPDRVVAGRFEALDEAGRLVLTKPDGGREAFSAGDVFFASAG